MCPLYFQQIFGSDLFCDGSKFRNFPIQSFLKIKEENLNPRMTNAEYSLEGDPNDKNWMTFLRLLYRDGAFAWVPSPIFLDKGMLVNPPKLGGNGNMGLYVLIAWIPHELLHDKTSGACCAGPLNVNSSQKTVAGKEYVDSALSLNLHRTPLGLTI